jgi:hypothetical protein
MPEFIRRAHRSAEFHFDRLTVRARNDYLDAAFSRDTRGNLQRIYSAVTRGSDWFKAHLDVSMSVLYVALRTLTRLDDARFAFVGDRMQRYKNTYRDPAFRMLDINYDPAAAPFCALPDVMTVRPYLPIELLMIDAVWADIRHQPGILERLQAIDDQGGYGTTHIVVAGLILLANGGAPEEATRRLMATTVQPLTAANDRTAYAGDVYAERIMVLQWLGLHKLVRPAWIMRLLRAQLPDGGWRARNIPPFGQSNQHTTILAMAALAEFYAAHHLGIES